MKFALFVLFISTLSQAAEIDLKGSSYFKTESQNAIWLLPTHYLDSVTKNVVIEEKALKSDDKITDDLCAMKEGAIFGTTSRNKITISSKLVKLAETNTKTFDCSHGTFKKMLHAVVIHEITHVKDSTEKLSIDPDYQRAVGMKSVAKFRASSVLNNSSTSPDRYEYKNLSESLAVNTEYFILDEEFECRKPATASVLSRLLNIPLSNKCKTNNKIMVQSSFPIDNYSTAVALDSKRIYQIHYLLAGKGKAAMSQFGHAMIRLVICAPSRKVAGPECMNDVSHHLVLTYRAFVTDINMNYMKGMFGGYPSQLFIMKFLEIQQEYTKFEFRELYSVPLKMTQDQKTDFLKVTLERFWAYEGKYYFFNNNCGTEAQKHLAFALDESQSSLIGSLTPQKIYQDILKHEAELSSDTNKGLSREQLIEKRILIPGMYDEVKANYEFIKEKTKTFKNESFDKFLKTTTAASRLEEYRKIELILQEMTNLDLRKQIVHKIVFLERYLTSKFGMTLTKTIMTKLDSDPKLKEEVLENYKALQDFSRSPVEVIHSRYSIPSSNEFELAFKKYNDNKDLNLLNGVSQKIREFIQKNPQFAAEVLELENLDKTKEFTVSIYKYVLPVSLNL